MDVRRRHKNRRKVRRWFTDGAEPSNPSSRLISTGGMSDTKGCKHPASHTDPENIERYGVAIIADEVTFLSLSRSRQSQDGTQDHGGLDDDDIPF